MVIRSVGCWVSIANFLVAWLVVFLAGEERIQIQVKKGRVLGLEGLVLRRVEQSTRALALNERSHYFGTEAMGDQEGGIPQADEPKDSDNIIQVCRSSDADDSVLLLIFQT